MKKENIYIYRCTWKCLKFTADDLEKDMAAYSYQKACLSLLTAIAWLGMISQPDIDEHIYNAYTMASNFVDPRNSNVITSAKELFEQADDIDDEHKNVESNYEVFLAITKVLTELEKSDMFVEAKE